MSASFDDNDVERNAGRLRSIHFLNHGVIDRPELMFE